MNNIPRSKRLETKRCYLRARELEDNAFVFSATRVKGFNDGMLWDPPKTEEELVPKYHDSVKKWNDGVGFIFTICENQTHQRIGMIAITRTESENGWSVGYWTHPSFQSRGFMSESVGAILAFGFKDLGAARIEAHFAAWNKASEIVLARNGMVFLEYQPQGFKKNGQWIPANKMAISKEAWDSGICRIK
jgi:[ribosomal protein S5]-alanine N-acetyltransferase